MPLVLGVKLLITLGTLILVTSWKVNSLHMLIRTRPPSADLATQVALELPNVFPFSDLAGVSIQVLLNSSVFPTAQHSIILHLQCSQILHEEKINVKLLSNFFPQSTQLSLISWEKMEDANEFLPFLMLLREFENTVPVGD